MKAAAVVFHKTTGVQAVAAGLVAEPGSAGCVATMGVAGVLFEPIGQHPYGVAMVLVLASLVLAGHDKPRGPVRDPHSGLCHVAVLPAGT